MMKLDNIVLHEGGMKGLINDEAKYLIKLAIPGYQLYTLGKSVGKSEEVNQPVPFLKKAGMYSAFSAVEVTKACLYGVILVNIVKKLF